MFKHKGSYSHVPGYAEIHFQQGLDGDGWELDESPELPPGLSPFARSVMGGSLVYRRGDEWATVPNLPYNHPAEWQIRALEWQATRCDENAAKQDEMAEREPWRRADAAYNRKQAAGLREEAERLRKEGNGRTVGKPAL